MKRKIKILATSALVAGTLAFTSCDSSESKDNGSQTVVNDRKMVEVTPLVPREASVGAPGEWEKMHTIFLETKAQIDRDPQDYASQLKMADLYIVEARATGNYNYYYPAAVKMIDGVLAENPKGEDDMFRALTSKAVILLSLHRFDEALEMGEKALAINQFNSRVYGILTDANVELGNYSRAVTMVDSMVGIRPDLRSYSRVSYLREIYGDVDGAKEAMTMAVKAGAPGHEETSWTRVTLGNLYENYGDLTQAEQQYILALQGREKYPFALAGLATIEAKKGNMNDAVVQMNEAIAIRPEASFYEKLALFYEKMGEKEKAGEAKRNALETLKGLAATEDTHVHGQKEEAHAHEHKHEGKGEKHSHAHTDSEDGHDHGHENGATQSTAAHGHSHEVGLEMAKMQLALTDNNEEALHNALHEYAKRPENIDVNGALAHIYLNMGKLKQAQEHYLKATATGSKNPEMMMIGGMIKFKEGQKEEGRKMIKKSLETNPYQFGALADEARKMNV